MSSIGNMLTSIRNAVRARHSELVVPFSGVKERILELLKKEKYIDDYKQVEKDGHPALQVTLSYFGHQGRSAITNIRLISKPSRRFYSGYRKMQRFMNGYGTVVVSTSQGIMTDKEMREKKLGGELMFNVW